MKNPKSLRTQLTTLVLACWVIPVAAAGLVGLAYLSVTTRSRVEKTVYQEAEYAASQVMEQINQAIDASRNITRYTTLYDITKGRDSSLYLKNYVQNILYLMYGYQNNIMFAGLFLWNDPANIMYIENVSGSGAQYARSAHDEIRARSPDLEGRIGFYIDGGEIYLIRNILDRFDYQPFGTLVLRLNPATVLGSLIHMEWEPSSLFSLSGQWGSIRTEPIPDPVFDTIPYGSIMQSDRGSVYYAKWKKTDYSFALRIDVPLSAAFPELRLLTVIEVVLILLFVPMLVLVLFFFHHNVNRPMRSLTYSARRLEAGELGVLTEEITSSAEFNLLSRTFNDTSIRLKELFDKVYKEELAVRDAKILALRSQINPHFLNNTLELMNWQARMSGADQICDMIDALSTLMDAALTHSGNKEVLLADELCFAGAYIYIISRRFGNRLRIKQNIDDSLLSVMTPPLVIQPLMENAVIHGLEKLEEGELLLSVYSECGELIIEVYNTGELTAADRKKICRLLAPKPSADLQSSAHLGIKNVQERLSLLYGGNSRLSIESSNGGTIARINIPIRRGENPGCAMGNIDQ